MNKILWEKVERFEFDNATDQYGFSTRLALENHWTSYFTQSALLEYKKFMFLAATNNEMVSPSEIVDIVWHQHLIFTNSYSDFCTLLGKRIEHIPSTHNRSEFEKFKSAKERTKELYKINFGVQPAEVWDYHNEMDSLQLKKSKFDVYNLRKKFLIYSLLASVPVCILIFPLLIKIKNPYFLIGYILSFALLLLVLNFYAKRSFSLLYEKIRSNPIIQNLSPLELVFLTEDNLEKVVHGVVNNLIMSKKVRILTDNRLGLVDNSFSNNRYENCVIEIMKDSDPMPYTQLCYAVIQKPIFGQLQKSANRIKDKIRASKEFTIVIISSMIALGLFLDIILSRIITGIWRDKPVAYLFIAIIPFLLTAFYNLDRISNLLFTKVIPTSFKQEIRKNSQNENDWE
ncbi:hypothetical protein K6T82_05310 [Flavobacterium sp. 17A]|uniref:Uncharacterized protein n=1 Tax=Flavobacterium potami TaxID=2872310 RepID=A0A9X1H7J1_9FLAO|nr:hypothetical protein [Flavobacterium potami]MBZ4034173.1 hypothetical protein [Flavobacterium potami]